MSEALMEFLTLRIATRWDDTREKAKGSTENLAICSALLLTMVSISGEGRLGEEMKDFMDYETALQTYSVLGTLSLSGFFVATTTAIFTLVYITYLDSDEALRMWIEHCGYFVKLSFFSFFAGMFFYIVMVLLEFFTIIGPSSGFLWSLPGFTLLGIGTYGMIHSIMIVNNANIIHASSSASAAARAGSPSGEEPSSPEGGASGAKAMM